jgi:threonine dehydrogenase-like Zn-dependent dehydrogenase
MLVDEVTDPVPGPGQVLARTLACGICGSDLHAVKHLGQIAQLQAGRPSGGEQLSVDRDIVMGHEFAAEIVELGPDTEGTHPVGATVCSFPVAFDQQGMSAVGYSHRYPGGYGELMVLNEFLLLPVPDGTPADHAALTEPMAVGRHAVAKAELQGGEILLVLGCGPIGLAVIAALRSEGRGPIVAADFSPRRRALAEGLGADIVVDPAEVSPYDRWQDLAWPEGVDRFDPLLRLQGIAPEPGVVFECVGVPGLLQQVIDGSMRGTRVVVAGVCMEPDTLLPITGIGKEIELRFVLGYSPEEFAATLTAIAAGTLDVTPLITARVGIDGVPGAFSELADPEAQAKVVVVP